MAGLWYEEFKDGMVFNPRMVAHHHRDRQCMVFRC